MVMDSCAFSHQANLTNFSFSDKTFLEKVEQELQALHACIGTIRDPWAQTRLLCAHLLLCAVIFCLGARNLRTHKKKVMSGIPSASLFLEGTQG
jgi:hypothetical protein